MIYLKPSEMLFKFYQAILHLCLFPPDNRSIQDPQESSDSALALMMDDT